MSLRIRRLRLHVKTNNGDYGADIKFPDGLVLLNVDNSRGKSTILKSIVYALGLERMFGPVAQPPLPPAMTTTLRDGDAEWPVAESWVFLEIENASEEVVTVRRKVVGEGLQDWKLIDVWKGGNLTSFDSGTATQFYVRDPLSAEREQGFYTFLQKFIGWDLPTVVKHDGTTCPLYMECLLPLFYIEQTHGWTAIQATTPRFFQIRQAEKRAVEFILALESSDLDTQRQQLDQEATTLTQAWNEIRTKLQTVSRAINGALRDFPNEPPTKWPPAKFPYLEVYENDQPQSLQLAIEKGSERLQHLQQEEIPTAEQAATDVELLLKAKSSELFDTEVLITEAQDDIELEQTNIAALTTRLQTLDEDLDHNKGTKKLRDLGMTQSLSVAQGKCPTCHQPVEDTLLQQEDAPEVMTLDENIAFLEAQKQTLTNMHARSSKAVDAYERRITALTKRANDIRAEIRSLRRTLISAGTAPAESAIRERIIVDEQVRASQQGMADFNTIVAQLEPLTQRWHDLQERRKALSKVGLTQSDRSKITRLEELFVSIVKQFGFGSFAPDKLKLNPENFKPSREGFDLIYDISASDNVRIITAYLTALLELSRETRTNHPGLLVLDEPRQQNVKWVDLVAILERLGKTTKQQVIVATSDPPERLEALRSKVQFEAAQVSFERPLLKKLGGGRI